MAILKNALTLDFKLKKDPKQALVTKVLVKTFFDLAML